LALLASVSASPLLHPGCLGECFKGTKSQRESGNQRHHEKEVKYAHADAIITRRLEKSKSALLTAARLQDNVLERAYNMLNEGTKPEAQVIEAQVIEGEALQDTAVLEEYTQAYKEADPANKAAKEEAKKITKAIESMDEGEETHHLEERRDRIYRYLRVAHHPHQRLRNYDTVTMSSGPNHATVARAMAEIQSARRVIKTLLEEEGITAVNT
jgi:hypothetical protein